VRDHRDLGAQAGVAGGRLDLQQAFLNLRHFEFEQLHDEFGRGARQHHLRAAHATVDAQQIGAHTVADAQVFRADHLVAGAKTLRRGRIRLWRCTVDALHHAVDKMFLAVEEVADDLFALGVADLLQNDLFGSLGTMRPNSIFSSGSSM